MVRRGVDGSSPSEGLALRSQIYGRNRDGETSAVSLESRDERTALPRET
jgi:hypothetical protein